jgi:hypothetical protein
MRPRVVARTAILTTCVLAAGMAPIRAQSLAEVAREEEARRKQIKQPARVYTNKDLVGVPPGPGPTPPPAPADAATTSTSQPQPPTKEKAGGDDGSSGASGEASKDKPRDRAFWAGRMADLVAQLDRDRVLADALQTRINALTADFSARDDPAQRTVLGLDRQKAVDELDRMTKSIVNDRKAIADLQEEARRASVPPGWLR